MYRKILVPLDGSKSAEVALPYAEELAGRFGAGVALLYVSKSAEDPYQNMHQSYLQRTAETTKSRAEEHLGGAGEVRVESISLVGDPAAEIVEHAGREDVDLIVMATHGRSGVTRWVLGSVADRVVRATDRPVVLIRARNVLPEVRPDGIFSNKALVCLDGSKESEAILPHIEEIASKFRAEVVLLEVLATGHYTVIPGGYDYVNYLEEQILSDRAAAEGYLDKLGAGLKQKGLAVRTEVRFGNAAEEIIKLADEIRADVVAMSTHGRSGIARWALGSVANRVLRGGNTPILLVRPPKAD